MEDDLLSLSAGALAEAIAKGDASSVEAVRACLARIRERNPDINAVVTLDAEGAMKRAAEADSAVRAGERVGPLHGVPITIKDNIATAGIRTTASHPPLSAFVPDYDSVVVSKLKQAGAVILGKTNLPELAGDAQTLSPIFGRTNNPHDLARTAGGSSGGSAAAVASGMSFLDVGNDLLGSVRIPAHYCGVFAFVPTAGTVPFGGLVPERRSGEAMRSMIRFGFFARNAKDLALALAIAAGTAGRGGAVEKGSGRRFSWSLGGGSLPVSDATAAVLRSAVTRLAESGWEGDALAGEEFDFTKAGLIFLRLFFPALGASLPPPVRFLARYAAGMRFLDMDLARYLGAENERFDLIERTDRLFEKTDFLICPTAATAAFPHMRPARYFGPMPIYREGIDVDGRSADYGTATVGFTVPFTLTGHPVVIVPAGKTQNGLPIGLQVVGRRGEDFALIEAARRMAEALGTEAAP